MTVRRRRFYRIIKIETTCPTCGCRFTVLAFGIKARVLAFCPSCGCFRFIPAVGPRVPWAAGRPPPTPVPACSNVQLTLFE